MKDRNEFEQQLLPAVGGAANVSRSLWHNSMLYLTVKDTGVVDLDALNRAVGVAAAELDRGRVHITVQADYLEEFGMAKPKVKVDYKALAKEIVTLVGGKQNVTGLRHCVTRCRFTLKDEKLADDNAIKALDGVVSVVHGGGEYMVVIGAAVVEVYEALCEELGMAGGVAAEGSGKSAQKVNPVVKVLNTVVGSVGPALNLICAGGILKGLLTLLETFGVVSAGSGIDTLLAAMGDGVFFFLPMFLGYNLAKHLKGDAFLGLLIGAIMCYPTLQGVDLELFGFVTNATYTSSFLPVIAVTAVAVPLSKLFNKYIPKLVSGFLTPVFTLLIVIPLGFLLVGPAVTFVGSLVNTGITALLNTVPIIAGFVFSGLYQVMVLFGVHQALTSFSFMSLLGGTPDAVMAMGLLPSFAQTGVVLAVFLRTKEEGLKEIALPAFISGIFGVTEPAIYGVSLPHIKMFIISCLVAGVGGAICMATNTLMYNFTGMGIFSLLGYISPTSMSGMVVAALIALFNFVAALIIGMMVFKDEA